MLTCENPRHHSATSGGCLLMLSFIIALVIFALFISTSEPQRRGVKTNKLCNCELLSRCSETLMLKNGKGSIIATRGMLKVWKKHRKQTCFGALSQLLEGNELIQSKHLLFHLGLPALTSSHPAQPLPLRLAPPYPTLSSPSRPSEPY